MKNKIPWNLVLAKLKNDITPKDDKELTMWLEKAENKAVYDDIVSLWNQIQANASDYTPDKDYYWKQLVVKMHQTKTEPRRMVLSIRRAWLYAAVICCLIAFSTFISYYVGQRSETPSLVSQHYSCLSGKSKVILPDGSEVWLHAQTSLDYQTDNKTNERLVAMSGEAYFNVTHDSQRPFIVRTKGLDVEVHGTKFNVEAVPNALYTTVSLKSGSVSLKTNKEVKYLSPNEIATFDRRNRNLSIEKNSIDLATSWANSEFYFDKKPLGYVCRYLSKWYNVKIKLDDRLNNKYLYTFTLRNESLEEIMRLMSRINPIDYSFDESNQLIIKSKE